GDRLALLVADRLERYVRQGRGCAIRGLNGRVAVVLAALGTVSVEDRGNVGVDHRVAGRVGEARVVGAVVVVRAGGSVRKAGVDARRRDDEVQRRLAADAVGE